MRRIAGEYSDEVTKVNKKEDLLLERKLRVFDRQERVARSSLKKVMSDIERFKSTLNMEHPTMDLEHYDKKRRTNTGRFTYGRRDERDREKQKPMLRSAFRLEKESQVVKLPPLHNVAGRWSNLSTQGARQSSQTRTSPRLKTKPSKRHDQKEGHTADQSTSYTLDKLNSGHGSREVASGMQLSKPAGTRFEPVQTTPYDPHVSSSMTADWVVTSRRDLLGGQRNKDSDLTVDESLSNGLHSYVTDFRKA